MGNLLDIMFVLAFLTMGSIILFCSLAELVLDSLSVLFKFFLQ